MERKTGPKPGDKHNMLTYVRDEGRVPSSVMNGRQLYTSLGRWKCDCGKEVVCRNRYVVNGTKKSCGCLLRVKGEAWHKGKRRHAEERPKTVRLSSRSRCLTPTPELWYNVFPKARVGRKRKPS